jgi:hypothetical protein
MLGHCVLQTSSACAVTTTISLQVVVAHENMFRFSVVERTLFVIQSMEDMFVILQRKKMGIDGIEGRGK